MCRQDHIQETIAAIRMAVNLDDESKAQKLAGTSIEDSVSDVLDCHETTADGDDDETGKPPYEYDSSWSFGAPQRIASFRDLSETYFPSFEQDLRRFLAQTVANGSDLESGHCTIKVSNHLGRRNIDSCLKPS